jgi:SAM-dependent methyltransferase
VNCPVCLSNQTLKKGSINRFSPPLTIDYCKKCGSFFQNPPPSDPDQFYDEGYYSGSSAYSYRDERNKYDFDKYVHFSRLENIKNIITEGKLLDIGCSFGGFVKSALVFYDAYGLDISPFATKSGNHWLGEERLYEGTISDNFASGRFKQNEYQVVTMFEVAEHLLKPREIFSEIFNLLSPKGMLIIQTANFDAWQAKNLGLEYNYFMPGHLVYYTAVGLETMLEELGYKIYKRYFPTDFSLLAKLKKSRGSFKTVFNYIRWLKISFYHFKSFFKKKGFPITSSYVVYAEKPG